MEAMADGDEAAYAVLIERYQTPINAFVFRSLGNNETARELTQDVFVKAWFALPRVQELARFSTWLFQIAANLCRDHAKSKAGRNARLTDSIAREDGQAEFAVAHPSLAPDKQAQSLETMTALQSAISSLPVELREAFVLGAVEEMPYKDVAVVLGLSSKAVELRVYRARKLLAERLRCAA